MPNLPPLAYADDAAGYGLTVDGPSLARASARIRGHVRQQITAGASTTILPASDRVLPERPVQSVESVTDADGNAVEFTLEGARIVTAASGRLTVAYTHGFDALPDELVELVCTMAHRLGSIPAALVAGTQQEGAGPWQHTYGFDSHKAASGLTSGEKEVLARYWPRIPRTIVLGSPA